MQISQNGIDLIKQFEGFVPKAYKDAVGVWTIGYGTTKINGKPVTPNMTCTEKEATQWLINDANRFLSIVEPYIKVDLNQNQIDAIASFIYNVGPNAFLNSTLLKKLNAGDFDGAANEFLKWTKATKNGVPVVLPGLVRRRTAEQTLFLS